MKKQTIISIVSLLCSIVCFAFGGYGYHQLAKEQRKIVQKFMQDEIPTLCEKHGVRAKSVTVFGVEKTDKHTWAAFADIQGDFKTLLGGRRKFKRLYRVEVTSPPGATNSVIKLTTDF